MNLNVLGPIFATVMVIFILYYTAFIVEKKIQDRLDAIEKRLDEKEKKP